MAHASTRVIYTFIVDEGARFAYQAWHLAHSLVRFCRASPEDIHIQCTDRADAHARRLFDQAGFVTHSIARFGDGKFCNKIGQIENITLNDANILVLLDTDTIATADLREWLDQDSVCGKIVDAANPPMSMLAEIARAAGISNPGEVCRTDSNDGDTFIGNCNGGMYAIPSQYCAKLSAEWKRWATWLLENLHLLGEDRYRVHVDQVSFWLALLKSGIPFRAAPSNANYFTHFGAPHLHIDNARDIALIHYHNHALNVLGLIEPGPYLTSEAQRAVRTANEQIGRNFHNALFWSFRYECYPERGSGIGSRGQNCQYKRELLREHGIESAVSVLDVGCGDLEVVRPLAMQNYTGLDVSPIAIQRARETMPNGVFRLGMDDSTPAADFVICFEVLIHQPTMEEYRRVIDFITARTNKTLIVSGYAGATEAIMHNPMVFSYEPLEESLFATRRFRSVRRIGAHTDVVIYRCDV